MAEQTVEPEKTSSFADIKLPKEKQPHPNVDKQVDPIVGELSSKGVKLNPFTTEYFYDPDLFLALSSAIKEV